MSQERLSRLAGRVADGEDVDWPQAQAEAVEPGELGEVLGLRALAALTHALGNVRDVRAEEAPRTWGPLRLRERIGAGSFGEVYRAFDPQLRRDVALKLLPAERGPRARASMLSEARRLARIHHPNVIVVHGAEEHEGRAGFWMEFVAGRTLAQRVAADGPLGVSEAARIGVDLCGALAAVHAAGLVHGDVKAGNVMRADDGRILLMDFGAVSEHGQLGVTPIYAAPEVLAGAAPTTAADVYALGVLLYHLVTGAYPVEGERFEELRAAHDAGRRRRLRDVRPELRAGFVAAVERALAPSDARHPSAAAFARALAEAQAAQPRRAEGWMVQSWRVVVAGALFATLALLLWPRPPVAQTAFVRPTPAGRSAQPETTLAASAPEPVPADPASAETTPSEVPSAAVPVASPSVASPSVAEFNLPVAMVSPVALSEPRKPAERLPEVARVTADPGIEALDAALAPLAEKARKAEALEAFLAANCRGQLVSATAEAQCRAKRQENTDLRHEIRKALTQAEDDARRERVIPGDVRALRDKYGVGSIRWEFP